MIEKKIMAILSEHPSPFIVQFFCSFQDDQRLCEYLEFIWSLESNTKHKPADNQVTDQTI